MLRQDDLHRFRRCFAAAKSPMVEPIEPTNSIGSPTGIFADEIWQLAKSLQIAVVLGDAQREEAEAASLIARNLKDGFCISMDHSDAWSSAIAWVVEDSKPEKEATSGFAARSIVVGDACRRLRARGYELEVQTYGVHIPETTQTALTNAVAGLVATLGGGEVAMQLCRLVSESNRVHDGMWMLGNTVPGLYDTPEPALPIGWLFSLGLRYLARKSSARKPDVVWKTLLGLSIDFAAAINCQRYSQYEEMHVHPADTLRIMRDSVLWREVFALPQAPSQIVPGLEGALRSALTPEDISALDFDIDRAFLEMTLLTRASANEGLTDIPREIAEKSFPNLWKIGRGHDAGVNKGYLNPLLGGRRDYNQSVFLSHGAGFVVTLPRSMLREAFSNVLLSSLRRCLPERISDIIGSVMELAVANASRKAPIVFRGTRYNVGKQEFDIDVGVREGEQFTLFETKGKSLTAAARSGAWFSFYEDYTRSFLTMVKQLARNDRNLRQGLTPLLQKGEISDVGRIQKIAVSPLSFGSAADRFLSHGLLRAFVGITLSPIAGDEKQAEVTREFNRQMRQIEALAAECGPKTDEAKTDLFQYLGDFTWLDLGEVLYALDRSHNVADFLTPIRSISFSSRDFWTEIAFADAQGLTREYWRPVRAA